MLYAVDETKLTNIADSIRAKLGISDPLEIDEFPLAIDDIPTGGGDINIKQGTFTLNSDYTGSSSFTVNHNSGFVPNIFMFYTPNNLTTTQTMLFTLRADVLSKWRSGYTNISAYRATSTSSYSVSSTTYSSYGIKTLDSNNATIAAVNTNTSWKKGTYNWVAIRLEN